MAPEQAWPEGQRVEPAADVWALGAILYETLTGRPPFQGTTAVETLGQVREREPVPPRQLQPKVPKDLETICLKCLQKVPAKRYPSADALAEDLRRFLEGRPILARPIGPLGRAWRAYRRHRLTTVSAFSAVLFLLVGTALSTYLAVQENLRAEELSRSLVETKQSIDAYVDAVLEDDVLEDPRFRPLRKKLLADALEYYQRFVSEHEHDPDSREELAEALVRVAEISARTDLAKEALLAYNRAAELYRGLSAGLGEPEHSFRLAKIYLSLAELFLPLGKREGDQFAALAQALEILQQLKQKHPGRAEYKRFLARTHVRIGLFQFHKELLDQALQEYKAARGLQTELVRDHESAREYRADLAATLGNTVNVFVRLRRFEDALTLNEESVAILRPLIEETPEDHEIADLLANLWNSKGVCYANLGRPERAFVAFNQGCKIAERLARKHPHFAQYSRGWASQLNNLARSYAARKNWDDALSCLSKAERIYRGLRVNNRLDMWVNARFVRVILHRADFIRQKGEPEKALSVVKEAITEYDALFAKPKVRASRQAQRDLRVAHVVLAQVLADLLRYHEAIKAWDAVIRFSVGRASAGVACERAICLAGVGRHAEATQVARTAARPGAPEFIRYKAALVFAVSAAAASGDESLSETQRREKSEEYRAAASHYFAEMTGRAVRSALGI